MGDEDEVVLDQGNKIDSDKDEAVILEVEADEGEDEVDEGQVAHNEKVAKTMQEKAIRLMESKDIYIDPQEQAIAQQIFPRYFFIIIFYKCLHSLTIPRFLDLHGMSMSPQPLMRNSRK